MLAIKNNLMAENAARHLGQSYNALSQSVERLSSGLRINSAKDDAAGLAVRELVRADVTQLKQASRNGQDAISMLQTSDGAMGVVDELLIRMKELAEQSSTGSYSDTQRTTMGAEYGQLAAEITRISTSTKFNNISLLSAQGNSSDTINFHVDSGNISFLRQSMDAVGLGVAATADSHTDFKSNVSATDTGTALFLSAAAVTAGDTFTFKFGANSYNVDLSAYDATGVTLDQLTSAINTTVGSTVAKSSYDSTYNAYRLELTSPATGAGNDLAITAGPTGLAATADMPIGANGAAAAPGVDLTTQTGATNALVTISNAIDSADSYRAELGYMMNRLESAVQVLDIQAENLQSAESRISDVDVSTEMANMTRNQVLANVGISMLTQANQMPQMALQLLKA